jgi:hypothetical protein
MPKKSAESLAHMTGAGSRIKPTDDLPTGSPERALFVSIVLNNPPGHFQDSDAPLLAAYVRAACLEQTASSELAAAGFVIDGKPSGWLPILQAASRTMSTFSRMLKLNPAGRAATTDAKKDAPKPSYYERMAMEAQHDEPN